MLTLFQDLPQDLIIALIGCGQETFQRDGNLVHPVRRTRSVNTVHRGREPNGWRHGRDHVRIVEHDRRDAANVVQNVRQVGNKAFYRRGERWVDSAVPDKQEKQAIKVERFSHEYFDLIDKFGRDAAKYLAQDEPVTLELGGQTYDVQ